MVKFKCKNCKMEFDKFCDKLEDSLEVKCPSCGSHWVENIFEDDKTAPNLFPALPYTDPPYPQPWIGDPFPPSRFKHWCGTGNNLYNKLNRNRPSEW